MGSLGTSILATVTNILNNPNYRSAVTITPRTPTKGDYGGYDAVTDNEGTAVSTYGVPARYFPNSLEWLKPGDLKTGDMRLILKSSETVTTDSKITFNGMDWSVKEIKDIFFNDVSIAYVVTLTRKTL